MENINIREALDSEMPITAREINVLKNETLIAKNPNIKREAMHRLQTIQDVKEMLQHEINRAGTQDMPQSTVESYETLWIMLQDIERAEAATILGE